MSQLIYKQDIGKLLSNLNNLNLIKLETEDSSLKDLNIVIDFNQNIKTFLEFNSFLSIYCFLLQNYFEYYLKIFYY